MFDFDTIISLLFVGKSLGTRCQYRTWKKPLFKYVRCVRIPLIQGLTMKCRRLRNDLYGIKGGIRAQISALKEYVSYYYKRID